MVYSQANGIKHSDYEKRWISFILAGVYWVLRENTCYKVNL